MSWLPVANIHGVVDALASIEPKYTSQTYGLNHRSNSRTDVGFCGLICGFLGVSAWPVWRCLLGTATGA